MVAGKGSSTQRNGRRDDKAIEPILVCLRTSLKDMLAADTGTHEHHRYVLAYPVTLTASFTWSRGAYAGLSGLIAIFRSAPRP